MNDNKTVIEKKKNLWVSITGYRALIVLKMLMEKPCTLNEIIDVLKNNKITNKSVSKDTVRVTINTLKSAGCKFLRPSKANGYKYQLEYYPFCLNVSDEELNILCKLRDIISEDLDWQSMLLVNSLYDKLISLTNNKAQMEVIDNTKLLGNINKHILKELSNPKIIGKKMQITYVSNNKKIQNLDIIPHKLFYENKKMYLWCYIFKYKSGTMLSIENIIKINSIDISEKFENDNSYEVVFEVNSKEFELKENEKIISQENDLITVKTLVTNEFWFIQRILQLGRDCKIVSPDFFKQKLRNKLELIKQRYE